MELLFARQGGQGGPTINDPILQKHHSFEVMHDADQFETSCMQVANDMKT